MVKHPRRSLGSFGFAELLVDERHRVVACNSVARQAGVPPMGATLGFASPLASAALELVGARARAQGAPPMVVRDELRDQHWIVHAEVLRGDPLLVRVVGVDASAAVGEERRALLRGLVHGLRNASFSLDALLATVDLDSPDDLRTMVSYLRAPVSWLQALASGLGSLVERERVQTRAVQVDEIVQLAVERSRKTLEQHAVTPRCLVPQLEVEADAEQLTVALAAIIDNAGRHGPEHADVDIEARPVGEAGTQVELSVLDRGETLPPSMLARIWAPLQHHRSRGIGLGLTLARDVVLAHGGEVFAERPPTGGTRIGMRLPLFEAQ
jgi:two-component system, OmpR family, sensor histidine kinase VicK